MLTATCEDTLGKQQMPNKEWISPVTKEKLHVRKEKNSSQIRAEKPHKTFYRELVNSPPPDDPPDIPLVQLRIYSLWNVICSEKQT